MMLQHHFYLAVMSPITETQCKFHTSKLLINLFLKMFQTSKTVSKFIELSSLTVSCWMLTKMLRAQWTSCLRSNLCLETCRKTSSSISGIQHYDVKKIFKKIFIPENRIITGLFGGERLHLQWTNGRCCLLHLSLLHRVFLQPQPTYITVHLDHVTRIWLAAESASYGPATNGMRCSQTTQPLFRPRPSRILLTTSARHLGCGFPVHFRQQNLVDETDQASSEIAPALLAARLWSWSCRSSDRRGDGGDCISVHHQRSISSALYEKRRVHVHFLEVSRTFLVTIGRRIKPGLDENWLIHNRRAGRLAETVVGSSPAVDGGVTWPGGGTHVVGKAAEEPGAVDRIGRRVEPHCFTAGEVLVADTQVDQIGRQRQRPATHTTRDVSHGNPPAIFNHRPRKEPNNSHQKSTTGQSENASTQAQRHMYRQMDRSKI